MRLPIHILRVEVMERTGLKPDVIATQILKRFILGNFTRETVIMILGILITGLVMVELGR